MKTIAQVLSEFPQEVRERFDFSNASYKGALKPITGIVCARHGEFQQYAAQLRKNGATCPACGAEKRVQSRRLNPEEFIERAVAIHGDTYDFSKTKYVNMTTKVSVLCPKHGIFSISPIKLVAEGQGCPSCGSEKRGKRLTNVNTGALAAQIMVEKHANTFIAKAQEVHGSKYDYTNTVYKGARKKLEIRCPKHGVFEQLAGHHLSRGQGCPQCSHHQSKPEQEIADFMSLFTPVVQRDRSIIAPKELDIYLPEHNLAIEYCGMYWHTHRDQADEKKNKLRHAEKHRLCAEQGIRLITIYETEWLERPRTMRRLLRAATGNLRGKLMARKCELRKATHAEARAFYDEYHPQGGNGYGEHYALFWKGKMVACMRFTLGGNDRGHGAKNREWTLSRYATRLSVAGAASRLFKAFVKEQQPESVKSFSDNRLFSGGMYEQLGFELVEDVSPDYQVWSPKIGLRPKPHYQRRVLPKRLKEHGVEDSFDPKTDPRTEADMTYLMGAGRIYDCGKKRWVWTHTQE